MKPKPQCPFTASLKGRASTLALISISVAFSHSVQATSAWWDGGTAGIWGASTNWNTAADGSGADTVPGAGETATFNITGLNQNQLVAIGTATLSVGGMVFKNTGTTGINAVGSVGSVNTTITLGSGGLTMDPGTGAVTFADGSNTGKRTAFVLGAAQAWTNNSTAGALTLSGTTGGTVTNGGNLLTLDGSGDISIAGVISGAGGLTKTGNGTSTLTAANSFTGVLTLNAGVLNAKTFAAINTNSSIGKGSVGGSAADLVFGGGTLRHDTITAGTTDRLFTIGNSNGLTATLDSSSTAAADLFSFTGTGAIAFGGSGARTLTLTGTNTGTNTFASILGDGTGGATSLVKSGAGKWTLTGANTYTGGTSISAGTLSLTGSLAGSNVSTSGTGILSQSAAGVIAGLGNTFTQDSSGTSVLAGANTYTGATSISAGTLSLTGSLAGSNVSTSGTGIVSQSAAGVIGGTGTTFTQGSSGTSVLAGANTYTGNTTLTSGTLSVEASNNLGGAASALVFDGGTLRITGTALTNFTGIGHTVSFNANKTVGLDINSASNTFTADQVLNQGTGGLTKSGAGFLVLNQANTYSGVTTITAGQVNITAANNLGDGSATNSITLNGGTLDLTAGSVDLGTNRAITLLANSLLQADTGAQLTVSGAISGAFRLTVVGQGTTVLSNTNNTFTDLTLGNNATSPIVQVSSIADAGLPSPLGSSSQILMGSGDRFPVLRLVGSTAAQTTNRTIGVGSGAGGNGTSTIANDNTDANHTLTFTGSAFNYQTNATGGGKTLILAGSNAGNNAINGVIQDNTASVVKLTKSGTGTWVLLGNNTYTGLTTVSDGKLSLARVGGTIADTAAVTVTGGTLDVAQSDTVGVVSMSGGTISGAGILTGSSFSFTGSGTASAVLAGSAGAGSTLTKTGIGGTAVLSGANTFAGKTSIGQGALSVSSLNYVTSGTWGNHSASNLGAPVTVADGTISFGQSAQRGTLIYTGAGETTDRVIDMAGGAGGAALDQSGSSGLLKFTSALTVSSVVTTSKTLYLLGSTGGSGEFAGAIVNGGAGGPTVINVDKDGSGTWTLSGNNSYTGATTISAGTLLIDGDNSAATGAVNVASPATLGGGGIIGGAVSVSTSAFISSGDNGAGNLTLNNGLTLAGAYSWDLVALSSASPGTNFDILTLTAGNANITGAALGLNLGAFAPSADPFWDTDQTWSGILNNTGGGSLTGVFAITNDQSTWASLGAFSTTNTGNDVNLVWTAIPEPDAAMLVGGLGVLALLRRRRA